MIDSTLIEPLLQTISTGLLLVCIWFAKMTWSRLKEMEEHQAMHRLELERKISDLKLETTTRIVQLESTIGPK